MSDDTTVHIKKEWDYVPHLETNRIKTMGKQIVIEKERVHLMNFSTWRRLGRKNAKDENDMDQAHKLHEDFQKVKVLHCHVLRRRERDLLVDFLFRRHEGAVLLSGKRGFGKTRYDYFSYFASTKVDATT